MIVFGGSVREWDFLCVTISEGKIFIFDFLFLEKISIGSCISISFIFRFIRMCFVCEF